MMPDGKKIIISHRSTEKEIADMLLDFFLGTGVPRNTVFCSSLPGNDINEKISVEVKQSIRNSVINIAILSAEYYNSAYCLNEAGILWYLDIPVIPIAMPEITYGKMYGFLNNEYKIRRLDSADDIAYIYDTVEQAIFTPQAMAAVITRETKKLMDRYLAYLPTRGIVNNQEKTKLDSITTDDERIILYYLLFKNVRKISKSEIKSWMINEELFNVNINNAFDLLSSVGSGKCENDTLELDISVFRDYSTQANQLLSELKPFIEGHRHLSKERFVEMWKTGVLDNLGILFVSYIVDTHTSSFGVRWKSEEQIENIKKWETDQFLTDALSSNYNQLLNLFIENSLVFESSWTSYGNSREYTMFPSLRKFLFESLSEKQIAELKKVKDLYAVPMPF